MQVVLELLQDIKAVGRWAIQADEFPVCSADATPCCFPNTHAVMTIFAMHQLVHIGCGEQAIHGCQTFPVHICCAADLLHCVCN